MSDTDKSFTKRLKHDINQKNAIRSEIERLVSVVSRWSNNLSKFKSFQEQSKCAASIKRYLAKIEHLRALLIKMNEEIDKRICETEIYSSSEVEDFKSQLEKEMSALGAEDSVEKKQPVRKQSVKKRASKKQGATGEKKSKSKRHGLTGAERLQKKIEKMRKGLDENFAETERVTGRILQLNRRLGMIGKGGDTTALTAEESSRSLFTQELKRIERERFVFGS
ncbi:MAG: hypothetical protein D8M57_11545 [Candidatus Scalindua sp. AMX11]|nr:MAG: hypothetical protein DWQ00_17855 [Candidatus Scalindua sp.]NOG85732.1 hypothetical protein [Planctomycetota bacterium]RZV73180.1 MAG: hypothetical protein EX341_13655 [Candidatus Scalindua sp. SCAELEC01]TDE64731.1 MAG: hypothetical protein D8M57_11545 [Candidatus Scalindua sp. AMX11]GJQ58706.1 MAG: hypothetical protein SCALA701_15070 [Candidatus Scalindua sp.]